MIRIGIAFDPLVASTDARSLSFGRSCGSSFSLVRSGSPLHLRYIFAFDSIQLTRFGLHWFRCPCHSSSSTQASSFHTPPKVQCCSTTNLSEKYFYIFRFSFWEFPCYNFSSVVCCFFFLRPFKHSTIPFSSLPHIFPREVIINVFLLKYCLY